MGGVDVGISPLSAKCPGMQPRIAPLSRSNARDLSSCKPSTVNIKNNCEGQRAATGLGIQCGSIQSSIRCHRDTSHRWTLPLDVTFSKRKVASYSIIANPSRWDSALVLQLSVILCHCTLLRGNRKLRCTLPVYICHGHRGRVRTAEYVHVLSFL